MTVPTVQISVPMKSTGIAYLLWLFFGGFGAHKFYVGRPWIGCLYIVMLGLFWFGILGLSVVAVDNVADAVTLAMQQGSHPSPVRATPRFGRAGASALLMIAPLSFAYVYDLFTMPLQVRAANNRLVSEASGYFGSGSKQTTTVDSNLADSERFAKADQTIARYKAQQAASAATTVRPPPMSTGTPTFGKRR